MREASLMHIITPTACCFFPLQVTPIPKLFIQEPPQTPIISITLPVPQWAALLKSSNIAISLGFHPLFFVSAFCNASRGGALEACGVGG